MLPHGLVVVWWVVFCVIVPHVVSSWHPIDEELSLLDSILDPIEAHINGFGSFLFDGLVGKASSHCVINLDWGWWLRMAHFDESGTEDFGGLAVDK